MAAIETFKTKFDLDNPQVEVKEVDVPELNARIMAAKIANMLQRGMHFRRVAGGIINMPFEKAKEFKLRKI